ncbi:hypothetical protein ACFWY6_12560 [Streptomyces sp. NPDC059037]|uniref:hypothetical protein n=1 Tax=Streptomyces sp. NPDC059037 TaxID=3346710 RepID=UPI00369BA4DC
MAYALWQPGQRITAARLNAMAGLWQPYTPVWTADSGTTTLGDGTLLGRYQVVGPTVNIAMRFTWGATSAQSVTDANWSFSLPVAPYTADGNTWQPLEAWIFDTSASARWQASAYVNASTQTLTAIVVNGDGGFMDSQEMPSQTASSTTTVQPGNTAWAVGDRLNIWGSYEAAS